LTEDHTVAAEQVASGQISAEEAVNHPQRHILTRTLGLTRFVNIDEFDISLEPGDRLLLCSDGLNEMVGNSEIQKALGDGTADEASWHLVEIANEEGGVDNTTVIVVDASA
jgi:protein phosphatase